jgi:photosystem II stability/assembly factor-like uncharacterized protein
MKKVYILIISLFLGNIVNAQWHEFVILHTYGGDVLSDVNFISENNGMYSYTKFQSPGSGSLMWLLRTNDYGKNWYEVDYIFGQFTGSNGIYTVKNQNTFYHATLTMLKKTDNNGISWNITIPCYNCLDFYAKDTSHLFSIEDGTLNKYINGTVSRINNNLIGYPNSIVFSNNDTGYIATSAILYSGNHSTIYKTIDGGSNFTIVFTDSTINIKKLIFTSINTAYAIADSGKVIKSTNAGLNWQLLSTNTNLKLNSIYFINDTVGYIAGNYGLIMKTIDGGNTWNQQFTNTIENFSKIFFVNDTTGFALSGKKLYTNNINLGIKDKNETDYNIFIHPNPSIDKLTIDLQQLKHQQSTILSIYNIQGQLLLQQEITQPQTELNIAGESAQSVPLIPRQSGPHIPQ